MAIQIPRVRPGDLITSDLLNGIAGQIEALDARLTALAAQLQEATGVYIYSILPSPDVVMGTETRIVGRGFGLPAENTVQIDNTQIISTFKAGSSETQLIFDMPQFAFSGDSKPSTIRVSNARGFYETTFKLVKATPTLPDGTIRFDPPKFRRPAATGTNVGTGAIIEFPVNIISNLEEDFILTPGVPSTPPGWNAEICDQNGNPLPNTVKVPRNLGGTNLSVFVKLAIPVSSGPGSASLAIRSSRNSSFARPSGLFEFTIGSQPPATAKVKVNIGSIFSGSTLDTAGILIVDRNIRDTLIELAVDVIEVAGPSEVYRTSISAPLPAGWTATVVQDSEKTFTTPGRMTPLIQITAASSTIASGSIKIRVESKTTPMPTGHFGELNQQVRLS